MKKSYLLAMALAAMVSCTSDEFIGDSNSPNGVNGNGSEKAIAFASNTPRITRASGADAAQELGYSFNVYATKTMEGATAADDDDVTSNVFALSAYSETDNTPYQVWYTASSANQTTSNTYNWEYVGAASSSTDPATTYGTTGYEVTLASEQTIKYWDYSAKNYIFTAYSTKGGSVTKMTNNGFTFTGTAAQVADMYVADKLTITEKSNPAVHTTADNKIGDAVKLTFRSAATKVRLGIYETISGYVVKDVSFRPNGSIGGFAAATKTNATLSGSFNGNAILSSSSSDPYTFTITYDAASNVAQLITSSDASSYFDFGTFASSSAIGETSTAPTWASGSSTYNITLPNTNHVGNMVLYVDYDLYNSVSGETIHVKGAKAVVPEMYMTWNPNYAYTYLFKISDNTNGTTGIEGESPEGIFPITFDALTIAATEGSQVGTITTVTTPAITTYQNNSVSASGITYAHASGPIYITVNTNGTLADLSVDNTKLYTVEDGTTEADLILNTKTKTAVTSGDHVLSILSADATVQDVTFTSGKAAEFTPNASTNYAIEFATIETVTGLVADTTPVTGYYTRTGDTAPYNYSKITDPDAKAQNGTTYYSIVYQYKIIAVGS